MLVIIKMNTLAIIGVIVGVIGIFLIIIVTIYNKYQWLLIKLDKGETNITNALIKKYNILLRYVDFLKSNINLSNKDFEEFKLINTKMPMHKLNKKIEDMNNIINKYMDNNEKLLKNDTIVKINKELLDVNIIINGCKKYYNDNLVKYNHLCHSFPSNLISNIFKYKEKAFLNEENKEQLKILNEDDEE